MSTCTYVEYKRGWTDKGTKRRVPCSCKQMTTVFRNPCVLTVSIAVDHSMAQLNVFIFHALRNKHNKLRVSFLRMEFHIQ
jgi:hypothetical protein